MNKQPKNILRISDLTFVLPDDFDGNLWEAIDMVSEHIKCKSFPKKVSDKYSTIKTLLVAEGDPKLCMKFGIFTIDENGNYKLKP